MSESIFQQAEQERIKGSTLTSIELYRQVDPFDPDYISAQHMLSVSLRVMHQLDESVEVLQELLNTDLEPLRRAQVLRDLGDSLRVQEKYDEAIEALNQSFNLLEEQGAPAFERASTIGFISRVLAAQKRYDEAIEKAEQASQLFATDDNRHSELYHNIFYARLLALAGKPDEAIKKAATLKAVAEEFGKPSHLERLNIIEQHASNPEKMEALIKDQDKYR